MKPARLLAFLLASSLTLIHAQAAPNWSPAPAKKQPTPITAGAEARTAKYFDSIKSDPLALREFLYNLPKGGDLHNHMSGAIYAESYIKWAAEDGWCVDKATLNIVRPKAPAGADANAKAVCDKDKERPATDALTDTTLYAQMVDVMSMRNWDPARRAGELHFFDTFNRFSSVAASRVGDTFAESLKRGAAQNLHYLELIIQLDGGKAIFEGPKNLQWKSDDAAGFADMHKQLSTWGLFSEKRSALLDKAEARAREVLKCGTKEADKGCDLPLRYQCQVLRAFPKESVFSQIAFCFELANSDPRVVTLNLVQPEDWLVPVRDFDLHMRMIDYFHQQFSKVKITLHAGELTLGQVPPEVLGYHIPKSIDTGHAMRIGHGTDVMYNPDAQGILREMAAKKVAVEISPSSSKYILKLAGKNHPLRHYMKAGVPVAISTDDEGVSRSDLTNEYQQAAEMDDLTYAELKKLSRDSLEYGFLSGESYWTNGDYSKARCAFGPSKNSAAAIANLVVEKTKMNDGISYSLSKGELHESQGYALSIFPDRTVTVPAAQLNASTVQQFLESNVDLLHDNRLLVGTWNHEGKTYLDVAMTIPDRATAEALGKKYNQIAIYDLKQNQGIPTGGTGTASPNLGSAVGREGYGARSTEACPTGNCVKIPFKLLTTADACTQSIVKSERALQQWKLEAAFAEFEKRFH